MVDGYVCKAADRFEPKDADDPSNTAMPFGRVEDVMVCVVRCWRNGRGGGPLDAVVKRGWTGVSAVPCAAPMTVLSSGGGPCSVGRISNSSPALDHGAP